MRSRQRAVQSLAITVAILMVMLFLSAVRAAQPDAADVHWSFAPLADTMPAVSRGKWGRNSIDAFVLRRLEAAGIAPSSEADRHTLIRRLYLDLIGLPPTPQQVRAFIEDDTEAAYSRVVEQLLASPYFGERWGRHWLDLARYGDTDGYEVDGARPTAWHYRDWIIDAINRDLPFDQFTTEQLAGDLLPGATDAQRIATGFHRQTLTNKEGGIDKEEYRVYAVMDRVNTTGTVWLGLTIGCAQCHDHPTDAITQRDYYGLFAIFNNADEAELRVDDGSKKGAAVAVMAEREESRTTYLLHRGDFLTPRANEPVAPATPAALPPLDQLTGSDAPDRLDLARWLTGPAAPITARVAVNHIWMHLFGEGLVRTAEDFGVTGEKPTHPELLDYLAVEFIRRGWSRKDLIRLIVHSATYRQASHHRTELAAIDPANRLLHRQNRFRVEAEVVRDLYMATSGLLTDRIGGPSVYPPIPGDLMKIDFRSDLKWPVSSGADRYRRGMYTFFKRTLPDPNLMMFDAPDGCITAAARRTSNTPLQALALLNNEVFVEATQALGRRLLAAECNSDAARIEYAMQLCLARPATQTEMKSLSTLLAECRALYGRNESDASAAAGKDLPDGVSAVEGASWTALASALMNVDAFVTRE